MELALSLGDSTKPPFSFLDKVSKIPSKDLLAFGIALDGGLNAKVSSARVTVPAAESVSFDRLARGLHVNRPSATRTREADDGAPLSSPNSAVSFLQMEFCVRSSGGNVDRGNREHEVNAKRASSRAVNDDDENGSSRKKLRLSKEQSAYLEESFKGQTTLNPKQKLGLAKQLNLRPRQVEVWFQNRRARTKLKQMEVDCEYFNRCCQTLTEENRRLQRELQDLRALKTLQPFDTQLPATTLTMCPSCERVVTNSLQHY